MAIGIDRNAVWRVHTVETIARTVATDSGQYTAFAVEYGDTRSKVRKTAVDRQSRTNLTDVEESVGGAAAQRARSMQVMPLRKRAAIGLKDLNAMILAVGNVQPVTLIAAQVVWQVELARVDATPSERREMAAIRREAMHAGVAVAVAHEDAAV